MKERSSNYYVKKEEKEEEEEDSKCLKWENIRVAASLLKQIGAKANDEQITPPPE